MPYTGNNPRGLVLARDKALSKKVAMYHRITVPRFFTVADGTGRVRRPKRMEFPLIVKSLVEEASMGISKASIVRDDEALETRVRFMHERIGTDAIVEQFIPGREIYVGVLGNDRLVALPPRELIVDELEPGEDLIATESLKHNVHYQKKHGVNGSSTPRTCPTAWRTSSSASASASTACSRSRATRASTTGSRTTAGSTSSKRIPNPELANYEELASAAQKIGIEYPRPDPARC